MHQFLWVFFVFLPLLQGAPSRPCCLRPRRRGLKCPTSEAPRWFLKPMNQCLTCGGEKPMKILNMWETCKKCECLNICWNGFEWAYSLFHHSNLLQPTPIYSSLFRWLIIIFPLDPLAISHKWNEILTYQSIRCYGISLLILYNWPFIESNFAISIYNAS